MNRRSAFAVVIVLLLGSVGCKVDPKTEERRLLAEINRVAEESSAYVRSDEVRSPMIRLNELRPFFPERRNDIVKEAEAVKETFARTAAEERKLAELWKRLLELPLSDSYAKCVRAQLEITELNLIRLQRVVDEMNAFLDPSIGDRQTLSARVETIRGNGDIERRQYELETDLDRNCRRPPPNGSGK